jgi:hypothetical protein
MRFLLHPQIASMFHWVFLKIQEEYTKKSESIMYNERRQIEAKYLATLGEAIVQCHTFSCLTAHGPLNQQYCESHKHASHLSKCSLASWLVCLDKLARMAVQAGFGSSRSNWHLEGEP